MKRILAFSLILCLLLCGCAKDEAPATTATPTTEPTEATTEPTLETTAPTEPVVYRHPLTGELLDAPFTGRAVAFSIGNTIAALPHHGTSQADVFCEVEAEGGITRFLAIISDLSNTPAIGPIRSARTFFNSLSAAYYAPLAHCGGSVRGIQGYHNLEGGTIPYWEHMDQFKYGEKYYYRDQTRLNSGYAYEHTLFTTGENMAKALRHLMYDTGRSWDLGFQFSEEPNTKGEAATAVTVSFPGGKTSDFAYNADTGLYSMRQYDRDVVDGNNDEQLAFKNLLVIYADQSKKHDGYYLRSYYEIIGKGEGYFVADGKIVKINWSRKDVKLPFVYTYEDGTPVQLGVGKTYLGLSSPTADPIKYE